MGTGALVPDFRLAPEHPFPAALEDALSAYRWLVEQRGDPREVLLAGDSAGGALALSLMLSLRAHGEPMPAGAMLLCPGVDMTGRLHEASGRPHPFDDVKRVADAYLAGHPDDDPLVSPLLADLTGLPPLLVQCATNDWARPEAEALVQVAEEHGVDARLEIYPADTHVFHVFFSFLPEAADALAQAGRFAAEVLPDGSATAGTG